MCCREKHDFKLESHQKLFVGRAPHGPSGKLTVLSQTALQNLDRKGTQMERRERDG